MPSRLTRRRWMARSTVAALSCATVRHAMADTTVSWMSTSAVHCQSTSFRDQVGTGVVLTAMAASPDGLWLAAAGEDHQIRIVQTSDLATIQTLRGHRDRIRSLAFDPQGKYLASVGNDGQLILYDSKASFQITRRLGGNPALASVAFARNHHRVATVGFTGKIFVVTPDGSDILRLKCDDVDLRAIAFRDDDNVIAIGGRTGKLMLLDPLDGRMIGDASVHRGRIHDVCFHHQSNIAVTVGEDGAASMFDTQRREVVRRVPITSGQLFSVAVLNSQMVAVAGSDNSIRILNTDNGLIVRELNEHEGSVTALASVGGSLFSAGFDATLRRWSMTVGQTGIERIADIDPSKDR